MSPALSPTTQGRHKLSGAGSLPETVLDASSRSEKSQGSSSARSPKAYRDADDNKHHKWSGASPLSLASLNLALARFLTALRSSHQARIRLAALCSLVLLGVALLLLPRTHNGSNNRYGSHSRIVNPNLSSSRDDGVNIVSSHKHHRDIYIAPEILEKRKQIASDKKYRKKYRDPLWDGDCEPMQWWQETLFPVCNSIHEIDRRGDFAMASFRHIATGGYNDVFTFLDSMQRRYVMKTLKGPELTDFTDRNFDRARRDALIMERLTRSPYIMNIYGFCGFTLLGDYAPEKSMDHYLWRPRELLPLPEQLQLACQAARALADAHDIDGDGRAAITHGDFASKQYIRVNGVYRLNDFNRGRFLRWNPKKQETCTYTIGNNDGTVRLVYGLVCVGRGVP